MTKIGLDKRLLYEKREHFPIDITRLERVYKTVNECIACGSRGSPFLSVTQQMWSANDQPGAILGGVSTVYGGFVYRAPEPQICEMKSATFKEKIPEKKAKLFSVHFFSLCFCIELSSFEFFHFHWSTII